MPEETQSAGDKSNQQNQESQVTQQTGGVTEPDNTVLQASLDNQEDTTTRIPAREPAVSNPGEIGKPSLAIATSTQPLKGKKNRKLLVGILAIIFVAANAMGAWRYVQNNRTESTTPTTKTVVTDIDTLTIGATEGPANSFFPDEQLLGVYFGINRQIYEGLVGFTDKKVTPLLAKSWTNPDERTWIFTLKDGITFHTGKAVTANEVKASLDNLKTYDYWSIFVSTIETTEVVSDNQLKIVTTEPDALLLNRLSLAFITDLSASDAAGKNGTGAFMVDSSAPNDEYNMTLIPYDNYHGERSTTRKVVYKIYENDEAVVKALRDGEVDIAESLHITETKDTLTKEGFTNVEFDSPGAFGIYLNQTRSNNTILKNKDVRKAVAEAVDRVSLVKEVGQQHLPSYQVIPKSLPGHDASIKMPEHSIENAKASLAKAGYKNEPLEFFYIEGVQADAPIIIRQLRAAGFNIRERIYQESTIPDMVAEIQAGNFDLFSASFSSDFVDARDLLGALLHSTESTYPVLKDSAYDQILLESDKAFDPVERTKKLQEANRYIADNFLWIPVRNTVYMAYYKPDLHVPHDFFGGGNLGVYFRKVGRITNQQ